MKLIVFTFRIVSPLYKGGVNSPPVNLQHWEDAKATKCVDHLDMREFVSTTCSY